jgi:sulfur-carrier protein
MIRVVLPAHLRALARIDGEVRLEVAGPVTQRTVLDALEARHPVLRGTIRGHDGGPRRAFMRFFACELDLSHEPPDTLCVPRIPSMALTSRVAPPGIRS